MVSNIIQAVEDFTKAGAYEILRPIYHELLLPYYQDNRDYPLLNKSYKTLAQSYEKAHVAESIGERTLARHYCVTLMGLVSYF